MSTALSPAAKQVYPSNASLTSSTSSTAGVSPAASRQPIQTTVGAWRDIKWSPLDLAGPELLPFQLAERCKDLVKEHNLIVSPNSSLFYKEKAKKPDQDIIEANRKGTVSFPTGAFFETETGKKVYLVFQNSMQKLGHSLHGGGVYLGEKQGDSKRLAINPSPFPLSFTDITIERDEKGKPTLHTGQVQFTANNYAEVPGRIADWLDKQANGVAPTNLRGSVSSKGELRQLLQNHENLIKHPSFLAEVVHPTFQQIRDKHNKAVESYEAAPGNHPDKAKHLAAAKAARIGEGGIDSKWSEFIKRGEFWLIKELHQAGAWAGREAELVGAWIRKEADNASAWVRKEGDQVEAFIQKEAPLVQELMNAVKKIFGDLNNLYKIKPTP